MTNRADLTPRQLEVLAELARTGSRKQAAHALGMSMSALDKHLAAVATKLGTSTRQVVYVATKQGIL